MIASQYKIKFPDKYDMSTIDERIRTNGHKTDGFTDLYLKFYMVSNRDSNENSENSYCPLYIWYNHNGLNDFLFNGYYDNILSSFGWQNIAIGIPLIQNISHKLNTLRFAYEIEYKIDESLSLKGLKSHIEAELLTDTFESYVVIYNPDKWRYVVFYFSDQETDLKIPNARMYSIKHISCGKLHHNI